MNEGLVVLVRGIIAFFSLLIYTRILGKQQLSQLSFFEYILGITIGSIAAELTVDLSSSVWPHFVGLTVWFLLTLLMQLVTMKSRRLAEYLEGEPMVVIMKGKILDNAMRKMRIRLSDLLEMLRRKDVFDITEVEYAIVEVNGTLSILKKAENQTVTIKDMKIQAAYKGLNMDLIYDGKVIDGNLSKKSLTKDWLNKELKKQKINDPKEVYYATLNSDGHLYVDKYKDRLDVSKLSVTFENKEIGGN